MTTLHLSDSLLDGYVALFTQLEPQDQTILLNKLTESSKNNSVSQRRNTEIPGMYYLPEPENAKTLEELAGSWDDERTAEEIIEDLRRSRCRTREVNL